MAILKSAFVNDAYSQLRISGLTVTPSDDEKALALSRMDSMMAEWFQAWNISIGYDFENPSALTDITNVPLAYKQAIVTNLAVRLIPDYDKDVPGTLLGQAASSLSYLIGRVAMDNTRDILAPTRMARGSGNTLRQPFFNRYQYPARQPPVSGATHYMFYGDILDFQEDFTAFLGAASIVSYSINVDPLLTVTTSANESPIITYTISVPAPPQNSNQYGPFQIMQLTITDSIGRTLQRLINFGIEPLPVVTGGTVEPPPPPPPPTYYFLLEGGDQILLESGDNLLTESAP